MNSNNFDYSKYENKHIFNTKQKENILNRKPKTSFFIIFFLIIILLFSCMILKPKTTNFTHFYYIEIDAFPTYKDAISSANEITKKDCSGVIFLDTKYHVITKFYPSKNEAKKELEKLKPSYPNAQLFELEIFKPKPNPHLTKRQEDSIINLFEKTLKLIHNLECYISNFSSGNITSSRLEILIKNSTEKFSSSVDNFLNLFNTNNKFNIAKTYLNKILNCLQNIEDNINNSKQIYMQELVGLTINFYHLTNNL